MALSIQDIHHQYCNKHHHLRSSIGSKTNNIIPRRSMAIFAVGEGWTGALTKRHILRNVPGHFDEEYSSEGSRNTIGNDGSSGNNGGSVLFDSGGSLSSSNSSYSTISTSPVMIYPYDDIEQASVGWGVTAFIDTQGSVRVVGRPHDVVSLLRMNRMPQFIQRWINRRQNVIELTPVGSAISNLIGWATGIGAPEESKEWDIAQEYSTLHDWTKVPFDRNYGSKSTSGTTSSTMNQSTVITSGTISSDARIKHMACGPGFMAMVGSSGSLYTMGVNNRGQCGIGIVNNNVWTPQLVKGLTLAKDLSGSGGGGIGNSLGTSDQDQPIVQVALGFQHGYALSRDTGQVFSWGKGNRGQLGREMNSDQDPLAGPIRVIDPTNLQRQRVVEIGAGHHHGALLTEGGQVYVWGKNMGRTKGSDESKVDGTNSSFGVFSPQKQKSHTDAVRPELVVGLPPGGRVIRISCGSHHTAMLLDDGSVYAIGIASDEATPILDPIELIPVGVLELPLRQFEAHYDRTTVIDNQGQIYQVHLWKDETLREYGYFTPPYVEALWDMGHSIRSIHRGWRHTIIVTE
jgi:alpha-tubulin suppressor-like RCC1 family protein